MDTDYPGGTMSNLGAAISGGSPDANNVYTFSSDSDFTLTLNNIERLNDNGTEGGIPYTAAFNKPWTMDDWKNLQWRVYIGSAYDSGWIKVWDQENSVTQNSYTESVSNLTDPLGVDVVVYFRDTMGNISTPVSPGKIKTIEGGAVKVGGLTAQVNAEGNQITVTWTTNQNAPYNNMTGAYLSVNGGSPTTFDNIGAQTSVLTVTPITITNVRNGQEVSNVQRYDISVTGFNAAGPAAAAVLSIWNIPGMNVTEMQVTQTNTVLLDSNLTQDEIRDLLDTGSYANYALAEDITVENFDPQDFIGRNFYGNGRTIIIKSFKDDGAGYANLGFFATVGQGSVVRDVTFVYAKDGNPDNTAASNAVTVSLDRAAQCGGIAGTSQGNAQFINVLVKGAVTVTSGNALYAGGMVGNMINTSSVQNACGGLNLTVTANTGSGGVWVGGVTGSYGTSSNGDGTDWPIQNGRYSLSECTVTGNITVTNARTGNTHVGGIIGALRGSEDATRVSLDDCIYERGTINVSASNATRMGGIIGETYSFGALTNCYSRAAKIIATSINGDNSINFGGFGGRFTSSIVNNCGNSSPIEMTNSTVYVYIGGFAGILTWAVNLGGELENCWSTGDVSSRGSSELYTGGLVGNSQGTQAENNIIKQCYTNANVIAEFSGDSVLFNTGGLVGYAYYTQTSESWASGSVTARRINTPGDIYVGGLAGNLRRSSITNCYSLGNVLADNTAAGSGSIRAGGIVGNFYEGLLVNYVAVPCFVEKCFSTGLVSAQDNGSSSIYTGGIVGYIDSTQSTVASNSCNVRDNAALGASVTAKGGSTRSVGRVYGGLNPANTASVISGNYAWNTTQVLTADTYSGSESSVTVTLDLTSSDGKDTTINQLRTMDFWLDTTGLAFNYDPSTGGMGIVNIWDLSTIAGKGHPILRNAPGEQ